MSSRRVNYINNSEMSSNIIEELDSIKSITSSIGKNKVMIKYYTPWCGSCNKIEKFYLELQKKYPDVKFYQVDASKDKKLIQYFDVKYVPSFHYYDGIKLVGNITGGDTDKVEILLEN